MHRDDPTPLLPSRSYVNVCKGEGDYWEEGQTHHIIDVGDAKLRDASSFGGVCWPVGAIVHAVHDQTGKPLTDTYRGGLCVGIRHPDGELEGDVPDSTMPHWVFK